MKLYLIPLSELYATFHELRNIALFMSISSNNWDDNATIQLGTDMEYSVILSLMSDGKIDEHILQKVEV